MSAAVWIGVAVLGGVGAVVRFTVDGRVSAAAGRTLPYGTLTVNLTGSLVLGALLGASVHGTSYVLAGTATIGSYTTFSTWMYETHRLTENGTARIAALNLAVSLTAGLGAAALGRAIGGQL